MSPSIGFGTNRGSLSFFLCWELLLSLGICISRQVNSLSYTPSSYASASSSSKGTQLPQQLSSSYARTHLTTRCKRNTAPILHMRRPPGHDLDYQFLDFDKDDDSDHSHPSSNNATANAYAYAAYPEQNQAVEAATGRNKGFDLVRNLSTSFVPRVPDSLNLKAANINISMPDIDYFKNLKMGNMNMNSMNITMPAINVTIPKVSLPNMNQVDINYPWTRTKRMRQTRSDGDRNDQFDAIIDVDAVTDKMDMNKRPLNLFGAFPELQLELELQLQLPLWNRGGRSTRQETEQSASASASPSSPSSSFPVLLNSTALLDTLTSSICKVTGKETYKFGDMSRYLDSRAKDAIRGLTGEALGLSKQVDAQIKDRINSLQLAKIQKDFSIADISRTIIRKVASGDYQLSDITFLCKVLVVLGADFSPVVGLLPVRLLLELFGYSIVIGLGERFMTAIVTELDRRLERNEQKESQEEEQEEKNQSLLSLSMVQLPLGNDITAASYQYSPGDLTKQAILEYTGKNTYQAGDIAGSKSIMLKGETLSVDIINELEECLAMERELVEKLNKINSQRK